MTIYTFTEKDFGKIHSYTNDVDEYGKSIGANGTMFTLEKYTDDHPLKSTRYIKIKKTVVYVAIDENDDGIIWEKWFIRREK